MEIYSAKLKDAYGILRACEGRAFQVDGFSDSTRVKIHGVEGPKSSPALNDRKPI